MVLRILRKQVSRAKALRKRHTLYTWRAAVLMRLRVYSQLRWHKQRLAHGEDLRHRPAQERTLSASGTLLAWRPAALLRIPYDVTCILTAAMAGAAPCPWRGSQAQARSRADILGQRHSACLAPSSLAAHTV